MARINPSLLEKQPKSNGVRNNSVSMMVLMKNAVMSAFKSSIMKVEMQNEPKLQAGLSRVIALLEQAATAQKNLEIGKASLTTDKVEEFRVANLEELKLENVESLALAFEQLDPIIKSLKQTNSTNSQTVGLLNKLVSQVSQLVITTRKASDKNIEFPNIQKVVGSVEVSNMPDNQGKVVEALQRVEAGLVKLAGRKEPKQTKIELAEGSEILTKLEQLTDAFSKMQLDFPSSIEVSNFPPQKYPMPVTHMSINSLIGTAKSRNVTVGTTPTPLPDEVLAHRRSLIIFNNHSATIYIGGSDVTTTNGLPILTQTYSPALDAGESMIIYGVVASATANVRVFEVSDENAGH